MHHQTNSARQFTFAVIAIFIITPLAALAQDPVGYAMTTGRLTSMVSGIIGLTSVVIGTMALRSAIRLNFRKGKTTVALVAGVICIVLSLSQLILAKGGFGTGSGKLGSIVALILGTSGVSLATIAMNRFRKMKVR